MSPRPNRPALDVPVSPLPFEVPFIQGQWLPGVISRCAEVAGISRSAVLRHMNLKGLTGSEKLNLGVGVEDDVADQLATSLGWTPEQVHDSTMRRYDGRALFFQDRQHYSNGPLWARGAGTRYCPRCLSENPGVFYSEWRLSWTFACTRHLCMLLDTCRTCHQPVLEQQPHTARRFDINVCQVEGKPSTGATGRCLSPLVSEPLSEWLPADSLLLTVQRAINHSLWRGNAVYLLQNLRANGLALLRSRSYDTIAELSEVQPSNLVGLYSEADKLGKAGPADALAMGAVAAAAWRLLRNEERTTWPFLRRITFSNPVRFVPKEGAYGPGSVSHLLSYWPDAGEEMTARVAHALDSDLPPLQRLLWGTAVTPEVESVARAAKQIKDDKRRQQQIDDDPEPGERRDPSTSYYWREDSVPKLLWPTWAAPLDVGQNIEGVTLQRSLSKALTLAATRGLGALLHDKRAPAPGTGISPKIYGSEFKTTQLLREVSELALWLDSHPVPINYFKRTSAAFWPIDLLPDEHWSQLAESVGESIGWGPKRLRVQRYMFLRATGAGTQDLPWGWRFSPSTYDVTDYSSFLTSMTSEFQAGIDLYLRAYLDAHGFAGPIRWAPPRWPTKETALSPELSDIDLAALHERLLDGETSLQRLSTDLNRSPRHIRWAIDEHPPHRGHAITEPNWSAAFAETSPRGRRHDSSV
jgi:hypothetical protein